MGEEINGAFGKKQSVVTLLFSFLKRYWKNIWSKLTVEKATYKDGCRPNHSLRYQACTLKTGEKQGRGKKRKKPNSGI